MSEPMAPHELVRAFKKWDVDFVEHPGWRNHHRNPGHGDWGPVNGILLHHTGDDAPDSVDERLLWNGRADLPGPLCTWGQRDDGVAVLIGGGRSNHAGLGAGNVFDALVAESYGKYPPRPGRDTVDGNTHLYGQETMYSGGHPMTLKAYRNTVKAFAAVCDHHSWSARSCIGHKEWTSRKPDPGHLDMHKFRKDVQACLDAGPGNWPAKKDEPGPVRKRVVALRKHIAAFLQPKRKKVVRKTLLAADRQLARIERKH